jgi:hypothetical protein
LPHGYLISSKAVRSDEITKTKSILVAAALASATLAPAVLGDPPDQERKEARKEQMEAEREEMKCRHEKEREDMKARAESERELRKESEATERERRKDRDEAE